MPVDYDLTVIGNTATGRYAAELAAREFARVALVTQSPCSPNQNHDPELTAALLLNHQRVDVVVGQGQFESSLNPQMRGLTFHVKPRQLTTRKALIALDTPLSAPNIDGLDQVPYLWPTEVRSQPARYAGQKIAVLGNDPEGLEVAVALQQAQANVVVITAERCILPVEDAEMVHYLQAQLEAIGLGLQTGVMVRQIQAQGKQWQILGHTADSGTAISPILVDQILLASTRCVDLTALNLAALGVTSHPSIHYTPDLHTDHPHLLICGDSLGGYASSQLGIYEAQVAVGNALFNRRHSVNYQTCSWGCQATLPFARVGLTELQAQRRYPEAVQVMRYQWQGTPSEPYSHLTRISKLILSPQGNLLGAHVISPGAFDVIAGLTLAMQEQIPIGAIARYRSDPQSELALILQGLEAWRYLQQSQDLKHRDRREGYFWTLRSQL